MIASLRKLPARRSLLGVWIVLFGVAALVAIWGHFAYEMNEDRDTALSTAQADTASLAAAYAAHLGRTLTAVDQIMTTMKEDFADDPEGYHLPRWLERTPLLSGAGLQVALVGADARVRQSTLGPDGYGVDLSDRPHIRHHFVADAEQPYISVPVLGRVSGRWSIQITRRLERADGTFGGVLVVSLDPTELANLFDKAQLGEDGLAVVVGRDRVVRALKGGRREVMGKSIAPNDPLAIAFRGHPSGTIATAMTIDDVDRIVSFAPVPYFPLVAAIGRGTAEALAPVDVAIRMNATIATILSLATLGLILLLVREARRTQRHEEELAEGVKLLDMILSVTPAAISVKDKDGRLILVNEAMARVVGRPRAEIEGRLMRDIFPPAALADVSLWDSLAWQSPGTLVTGERVTPVNGEPRHFLSTRTACTAGNRALIVAAATDITPIREAEAAMQRAARTEAASRIKSTFLANMSHELRTPLNAVIGFSEVMEGELLGPIGTKAYVGYARNIHTAGAHLLRVVNDILDLTKAEADKLEVQLEDVELHQVVESVLQMVKPAQGGAAAPITLDIPFGLKARADGHRVRQVLLNLLSNAVKFTPPVGSIVVAAAENAGDVVLSVRDTGPGMSAEEIAVALEPFGHVITSFTRAHDGTGLGLPLAKRIVEMMGGRLEIESGAGTGTCVSVRLPRAKAISRVA